jgi:hypothetical protein
MRTTLVLLALGVLTGCGDPNPLRPTQPPSRTPVDLPIPSITSLSPDFAPAGSSDLVLKVTGTNFVRNPPISSWVIWSAGTDTILSTTFVTSTELTAFVPAALLTRRSSPLVLVVNGDFMSIADGFSGYPKSNLVTFNVISPDMGYVTGVVTDAVTKEPIAGASVEWAGVAEAWGDRGHGVMTDANGTYQMLVGPVPGGGILMRAWKAGYESRVLTATVTPSVVVNFALTPGAAR